MKQNTKKLRNYTVKVISEIIYLVDVQAEDEDDACVQGRYNFQGPCKIKLEGSDEEYEGVINSVWSCDDVEVVKRGTRNGTIL